MKKIQSFGKELTKKQQKVIFGGVADVQCKISGGCKCPDGSSYNPEAACVSCADLPEGGFSCTRGNYTFNVTCANSQVEYCPQS